MIDKLNNANRVTCGICGSLNCKSIVEEYEYRICLDCGYHTHSLYKIGSDEVDKLEKNLSKLIKELRRDDIKLNQYWYLSVINVPLIGLIYPMGNVEDWWWAFCPEKAIPIFERLQYPIPGKKDEYYETMPAFEHEEHYNTFNTAYNKLIERYND
jgi:hypothetical protein